MNTNDTKNAPPSLTDTTHDATGGNTTSDLIKDIIIIIICLTIAALCASGCRTIRDNVGSIQAGIHTNEEGAITFGLTVAPPHQENNSDD